MFAQSIYDKAAFRIVQSACAAVSRDANADRFRPARSGGSSRRLRSAGVICVARAHEAGLLNDIAQFADVSRPGMAVQGLPGVF